MSRSRGRMISRTPPTSPTFQSRLVLFESLLWQPMQSACIRRAVAYRSDGRSWNTSKRETGVSGFRLKSASATRSKSSCGPPSCRERNGVVAIEPEQHSGLAPFADQLARLDGERRGQRDRPLLARVVVRDDDAVRLDALDDLRGIECVDDVEHLGLLGRALQGRRLHELLRQAGQVPEPDRRPERDGDQQARRHGIAPAPVPEPFDPPDRACADRLTAQVARAGRRPVRRAVA